MKHLKKLRTINGAAPTSQTFRKFWNVATIGDDEAEITMYGDVCASQPTDWWTGEALPGLYITPEGFLEDLEAIKDKPKIRIKLNSCGGDLYTGIAIHNALKGLKGTKTVVVEGIAASAASVIMCAGDDVQVYPGSMVMIHGVAGLFYDYMTIADLKKAIKGFDAAEQAIANIYKAKTGTDAETLRSLMSKETWMIGQDAVNRGFANTLLEDNGLEMTLSADRKYLLVAGVRHDVHAFEHIPGVIPAQSSIPTAPAPTAAAGINKTKPTVTGGENSKGGTTMNEQELRAQYPELVAQIEAAARDSARTEAIASERTRIQAIDSIEAQIADDQLIAEAKYGETACTAQELAFKAMQKNAQLGAQHLAGVAADAKASGAQAVGAAPNGGNADEKNDDEKELEVVTNAYNAIKGGKVK